ncbi:MAG: hypothetical protein FIA95_16665 [Gemmatimonadetes bacterium]|nr:hypothetical protein [Gemmatimonadota bacterium]
MIPHPLRAVALPAALVVLSAGCQGLGPQSSELLEDIALHRSIWESKRPTAYAYDLQRTCNCPEEAQGPVRVRVHGSQVVQRTYTATGAPLASGLEAAFPSVEGLFDLLEDAVKRDAWSVTINWNAEFGFPSDLYVDYDGSAINDEVGYRVVTTPTPDTGT